MGCFWEELKVVKALNMEQHGTAVFNGGAASVLCTFPNPDQTNQGFLFFQEFMVDSFIGIVIVSDLSQSSQTCLDLFKKPDNMNFTDVYSGVV